MGQKATRNSAPGGLRILSIAEVAAVLGITRSTLHRWIRTGHFPAPIQVGPTAYAKRGWAAFVVENWLQSRPTMPGAAPATDAQGEASA